MTWIFRTTWLSHLTVMVIARYASSLSHHWFSVQKRYFRIFQVYFSLRVVWFKNSSSTGQTVLRNSQFVQFHIEIRHLIFIYTVWKPSPGQSTALLQKSKQQWELTDNAELLLDYVFKIIHSNLNFIVLSR